MFRLLIFLYIAGFVGIAQAQDMETLEKIDKEIIDSIDINQFPSEKLDKENIEPAGINQLSLENLDKEIIDYTDINQFPSGKLDMVIVNSSDIKQFPLGKLLNSSTPLNLSANTEVMVAFNSGGTHKVIGPYQGIVEDPRPKGEQLVFDFYSKQDTPPESVEVIEGLRRILSDEWQEKVRGANKPENLWLVDAISTRTRFYCIAPSSNVTLWRPESQKHSASLLLIKHKGTGKTVKIVWPAHQTELKWPGNLPIVYGDTYTVEVKPRRGSPSFKKLVLYQLPDSLPTESHKVVWMAGRGCIPQANMLLASLH